MTWLLPTYLVPLLLSKVIEKLFSVQVKSFIEEKCLIDEFQTGYRANHSTQTVLLKVTKEIRVGIRNKQVPFLVDFSKAFDIACHVRLMQKLRNLGFFLHNLRWFESYLTTRSQSVLNYNSTRSSFL